nr:hypothetical protein [Lacticaseibacillus nasuensis]
MNIPMYVDTFIPEPPVNVNQLVDDVTKAQEEITQQNKKLNKLFSQFVGQDKAKQTEIEKIRGLFK